jgi:hypothetical protein
MGRVDWAGGCWATWSNLDGAAWPVTRVSVSRGRTAAPRPGPMQFRAHRPCCSAALGFALPMEFTQVGGALGKRGGGRGKKKKVKKKNLHTHALFLEGAHLVRQRPWCVLVLVHVPIYCTVPRRPGNLLANMVPAGTAPPSHYNSWCGQVLARSPHSSRACSSMAHTSGVASKNVFIPVEQQYIRLGGDIYHTCTHFISCGVTSIPTWV